MDEETRRKLDRLRAKRGGHRGVCTKLTKEVDELVKSSDEDQANRFDVLQCLLQEKLKLLNEIDEEILGLCDVKILNARSKNRQRLSAEY